MEQEQIKKRIKYYECNMTRTQHIVAYLVFAVLIAVVFYIYYHSVIVSVIGGVIIAVFQEKNYSGSVTRKRQSRLRLQFKEFLDIISISISGGSGQTMENAVRDSVRELQMMFNADSDIVREISLIVSDYDHANIPMADGFEELGERSDIDDITSFATIYKTIQGKSSDFSYIVSQTRDIIKDKVEITQEIETSISGAKSEAYMMLVLPLLLIVLMTTVGSGFLDSLYSGVTGRLSATFGLVCTLASYVIAVRATEIEV
ncbi:MAG: hypothetical protein LUH58_08605 [Lachnospiraceae bacterium]|nr:hypothetical protein [Lachnospiraceae bacterium]